MVKLWQGESAQWRVELELNGEGAALSLRMKEEGRVLSVCLGGQPTENTLRRAAADGPGYPALGGHQHHGPLSPGGGAAAGLYAHQDQALTLGQALVHLLK